MATKLKKKNNSVKKVVKKVQPTVAGSKVAAANRVFQIPKVAFTEGVGRRKNATARVRIYEGNGDFVINDKVAGEYFRNINTAAAIYNLPFDVTGTLGKFAVTVKVSGSGVKGQIYAVVHGLSRALVKFNPDFQPLLKQGGLLTRDSRMKESRKVGMGGKARRQRQSPKR